MSLFDCRVILLNTRRLYCVEWTQYSIRRSGPLYATGVSLGPPESSTQTASRSLQPFMQGSLGDRPTGRPRYSVFNNRQSTQWRSQIICYCLRLQQVLFIGAVDSTDRINFSNQQLYSTVRLDGLQCRPMWRHYNIASKTAFPTGVLDRWHNCLLIYWRTSCLVPAFDDT